MAEGAGVHPATASRALNPETRHLVSRGTVERVDRIAASLGYRVNTVARSLKTARSGTIGLLVPDLMNPLFPPIVIGPVVEPPPPAEEPHAPHRPIRASAADAHVSVLRVLTFRSSPSGGGNRLQCSQCREHLMVRQGRGPDFVAPPRG